MIFKETLTLANGVVIPQLALGTWFIDDDKAAVAVRNAIEIGYRHIDTAQAYGNERGVGEGVRTCGINREEIFVTSKVAAEHKEYKTAAAGIDETLRKMGLDYLDMIQTITELREKYGLKMKVERYISDEDGIPDKDKKFIVK